MQSLKLKEVMILADLYVGVLPPWRAACCGHVSIRFIVEQIKGLLTGAGNIGNTAAVPHRELKLHVNSKNSPAWDEVCPEPVVLIGLQYVTDLVCPDGAQVVIISTHFFPLRRT